MSAAVVTCACRACGAPFSMPVRWTKPFQFCPPCRARRCGTCGWRGGLHRDGCTRAHPRSCRGCGQPVERDGDDEARASVYCLACREAFCTTCQRRGGTHRDDCPRGRPPRERPVFGIVSAEDVAALYVEHYAALVRVAARYYAPIGAKDCVQDVTEWLLAHRAYLDRPLTAALFFAAVRNRALREWHYGRVMFEQPLDPDDLLAVEERLDAERWGHPRVAAVRLPDADAVT